VLGSPHLLEHILLFDHLKEERAGFIELVTTYVPQTPPPPPPPFPDSHSSLIFQNSCIASFSCPPPLLLLLSPGAQLRL